MQQRVRLPDDHETGPHASSPATGDSQSVAGGNHKYIETRSPSTPSTTPSSRHSSGGGGSSSGRTRRRGLNPQEICAAVGVPFLFPAAAIPNASAAEKVSAPACMICQCAFSANEVCRELINCGHCFHIGCIDDWFTRHTHCPVCRCSCKPSASIASGQSASVGNIGQLQRRMSRGNSDSGCGIGPAPNRPCWSPDYDKELLALSDQADYERRQRMFSLKGRTVAPRSAVFLQADMPVVMEEPQPPNTTTTSAVSSTSTSTSSSSLPSMDEWTEQMKKLSVAFVASLVLMQLRHYGFIHKSYLFWKESTLKRKM